MVKGYVAESEFELTEEDQEFILNLAGGYPFFVQMVGHYLFDEKLKGTPQENVFSQVKISFEEQVDPHYEYMWSHCSDSEKITLLSIIALSHEKPTKKTQPNLDNLTRIHSRAQMDAQALAKRGLVYEGEDNIFNLLSSSLERWIIREIAALPGSEESEKSVEDWINSGGRENLEPVKGTLPKIKKKYWPMVSTLARELSFELASAATFEILLNIIR